MKEVSNASILGKKIGTDIGIVLKKQLANDPFVKNGWKKYGNKQEDKDLHFMKGGYTASYITATSQLVITQGITPIYINKVELVEDLNIILSNI